MLPEELSGSEAVENLFFDADLMSAERIITVAWQNEIVWQGTIEQLVGILRERD